jgi:uncharacterized protein (DUF2252 family)
LITLELTADHNRIVLGDVRREQIVKVLLDAYRAALTSSRTASKLLADEPLVRKLLERSSIPYTQQLDAFTSDGRFRPAVFDEKAKPREILRPAKDQADAIAGGIAQAIANSTRMQEMFRNRSQQQVRTAIRDVALRTRLGSSGSQGLKKYVVLMQRPIRDVDCDLIIYLKQTIPSAAERAGAIAKDSRWPSQRLAEHMSLVCESDPLASSWCTIGDESYWVSVKEPWSAELEARDVKDFDSLLSAARIWGTVVGAAHARTEKRDTIEARLSDDLPARLRHCAGDYLRQLHTDFADFVQDQRTSTCAQRAERAIKAVGS